MAAARNHMDQRGRPPNLANANTNQQQQQQQPYGPYSQQGPNVHPQQGIGPQGQMMGGQTTAQQQHPGQMTGIRQPNQMNVGGMNQMGGGVTGQNQMGLSGQNQMSGQNAMGLGGQNTMGLGGQQNQMGPRGPQPQTRSMNQAQQQQLAQKKPRVFLAMFDYDPSTMSPNPDGCEEELAFQEGDTIKVSTPFCYSTHLYHNILIYLYYKLTSIS